MGNINFIVMAGLIPALLCLGCLIYVTWRQAFEVLLPRDWLSKLRVLIFSMLIVSIIGILPVIVYSITRVVGMDSEVLRNIAGVTGNLSRLATAVLLVLIYNYKKAD